MTSTIRDRLDVRLVRRLPDFTLDVAWTAGDGVVALFGPTLPERSMPWRDPRWFAEAVDTGPLPCRPCHQRVCAPGDFRCLTRITVDQVMAAAERALQHTR